MSGLGNNSVAIQGLEPRVLLAADMTLTTTMNAPGMNYSQSFQIGGGAAVTFSGNQLGDIASLGGGYYRYTPHIGKLGIDDFTASYQPSYGGYGGYGGYSPPPVTKTIDMNILFVPFGASQDESYHNPDPATQTAYPEINYFVLKENTLTITADKGVLKNDTLAAYVPYLTAQRVSNGQYGTFEIASSGAFTYTPYPWAFADPNFMGLEDTCQYVAKDPTGKTSQPGIVTVDLVELYITRNGSDVDSNPALLSPWVGEKIAVSVGSRGEFPAVPGIATFQWNTPAHARDGYTGYGEGDSDVDPDGLGKARELVITSDEKHQVSMDFHWIKEGTHELSVSVTVDPLGQTQSDDTSFTVNRPDISVSVESTVLTINPNSGTTVQLGNHTNGQSIAGITFTRELDLDFDGMNRYRWTQFISKDEISWTTGAGVTGSAYKPAGVDNEVSYGSEDGEGGWTGEGSSVTDSPDFQLGEYNGNNYVRFTREFKARMYLMYRRNTEGSIWVPLNVTFWGFKYTIKKEGNVWNFDGDPELPTGATPINTYYFPEWTLFYENDDEYAVNP